MGEWFFVSDLHGRSGRYRRLFEAIRERRPEVVLLGGDLFPGGSGMRLLSQADADFEEEILFSGLSGLRRELGGGYPRILAIPGNDDGRAGEEALAEGERRGLLSLIHQKCVPVRDWTVMGYAFVPPTPFLLKDFERYDVSRYVDPGAVPPEEGVHSAPADADAIQAATIREDLARLAPAVDRSRLIGLFHAPPYDTRLDLADLAARSIDGAPLDPHVGSIALRRFLEERGPHLALHGHVHESVRLSGEFIDRVGRTVCLGAAHDGPELALVSFDPEHPAEARRDLLPV
jgi:Icc-related predicted phosphoesterase